MGSGHRAWPGLSKGFSEIEGFQGFRSYPVESSSETVTDEGVALNLISILKDGAGQNDD